MREISIGGAISSGFRLIGREPAAFAAWCGVYLVLGFAPLMFGWGPMVRSFQALGAAGGATSPEMLAAQAELMPYQLISYLTTLLVTLLLPPAMFRAMLHPEDRGFFYMRLGARELWMTLATVVVGVMFVIGYFVAFLPILLVVGVTTAASGGSGWAGLGALLILPALGVLVWGLLRFSFAPVMSFAERRFRMPESWTLARGHAGRMFVVWLVLIVLTVVVPVVVFGAGFVALAAQMAEIPANPFAVLSRVTAPVMVVGALLSTVIGVWFYVMWCAAWAEMYRDLRVVDADVFN